MKGCTKTIGLVALVGASLLPSCASEESADSGVVVAETFANIPRCNRFRVGIVYYVQDTDEFFYCDGRNLVPIDLSGQDGEDGEDGQDGQDGTLCTVTRDDVAGTATISCDDGTWATVQDGDDGEDGNSCTIEEGEGGASTIVCSDGTSATIPPGTSIGEIFSRTVTARNGNTERIGPVPAAYCALQLQLASDATLADDTIVGCELQQNTTTNEWTLSAVSDGGLVACGMYCIAESSACPCFNETQIRAAESEGCEDATLKLPPGGGAPNPVTVEFSTRTLPDSLSQTNRQFVAIASVTASVFQCLDITATGGLLRDITEGQYFACAALIEDIVGPCEETIGCFQDEACSDGDPCTSEVCDETDPDAPFGTCSYSPIPECTSGGI